jgi:hypothetical protein
MARMLKKSRISANAGDAGVSSYITRIRARTRNTSYMQQSARNARVPLFQPRKASIRLFPQSDHAASARDNGVGLFQVSRYGPAAA